jgi:hypothetical protein
MPKVRSAEAGGTRLFSTAHAHSFAALTQFTISAMLEKTVRNQLVSALRSSVSMVTTRPSWDCAPQYKSGERRGKQCFGKAGISILHSR